MMYAVVVLACVAMFVAAVSLTANIELFSALKQIREQLGIRDDLVELDVTGIEDSNVFDLIGDPRPIGDFTAILFLSTRCDTCNAIAFDLDGELPKGTLLLVEAPDQNSGFEWISKFDLVDAAVVIDPQGRSASRVKINVSPALLLLERTTGKVLRGFIVPSARRLREAVSDPPTRLGPIWTVQN